MPYQAHADRRVRKKKRKRLIDSALRVSKLQLLVA
jgi:hypothetical protein